ncbi:MAG: sulfatase [Pirellulaceae bacterium]|nr:MAG: sulfatase [Pirellulaceae bacterium]
MNLNTHAHLLAAQLATRRHFLKHCSLGLASMWLAGRDVSSLQGAPRSGGAVPQLHFPPRVRRVIYLHMAGSPSQLELFDFKPELQRLDGEDCPASFLEGKRFAFIQGVPKLLGPQYAFRQVGEAGAWVSDRLPHFQQVADQVCFIKSMTTTQFNHAPAQLLMLTGNQNLGHPSMGAWITYGLGSENEDLPGFIVLLSGGRMPSAGKSAWGAGYLPSVYQGVQCRSHGDPVLFLNGQDGASRRERRRMLDTIERLNQLAYAEFGDPEALSRLAQYELAFRMQVSANEAFDLQSESAQALEAYGAEPGKESFANNCLLARRLVERGVRFVQLFHWGWDSHGAAASEALNVGFKDRCREVDQPMSALLSDLQSRGLLEDTLVVWGGEFGRTPMRENRNGREMKFIGRDHNPGAFTIWLAGAGIRPGISYGETDELGYQAVVDPVTPHDLHATILRLLGIDHLQFTFTFQGAEQRLSNLTKPSRVVEEILA